jgi:thioredoxin reductase
MGVTTEVTIVGAGPYGLSLAAYLKGKDVPFRILGTPMGFWKTSMPEGMSLKSDGHASSLFDPSAEFTLARFCAEESLPYDDLGIPVPLKTFITYGLAFQQQFVPFVEERTVQSVKPKGEGFTLVLDNGELFTTRNLVLAVGVGYFAHVPDALAALPSEFATHSSQHVDLSSFVNRDVAILGAGSSALDLGALLRRAGARPVIIARASRVTIYGLQRLPRTVLDRLRAPTSGIGPGWRSWLFCKAPNLYHYLPERWRLQTTKTHAGPSGGWFIKDAVVGKVPMMVNTSVKEVTVEGDRVRLDLLNVDGQSFQLVVDHVIAATGYRVDVNRLTFLDESLRNRIETVQSTPILSANFESSVSGLYFVGPAAANSFGPLQRFAVGAGFAARRLSSHLARKRTKD